MDYLKIYRKGEKMKKKTAVKKKSKKEEKYKVISIEKFQKIENNLEKPTLKN